MIKNNLGREPKRRPRDAAPKSDECGASHSECPNTWKGSCDRDTGHSGSHHCGACQSTF